MTTLSAFITGLSVGLGLIVAIGAQNAYVLRLGLLRQHVLPVVLFCALSDAVLIAAGVAGLGALVTAEPRLITAIAAFGAAFLIWYGFLALRRALRSESLALAETPPVSLKAALIACALFTWGNPHVYLDTVVLVGSLAAPYPPSERLAYALGAMTASFGWFFALGYGARLLVPLFQKPLTWRLLDAAICLVMWLIAARLVTGFLL